MLCCFDSFGDPSRAYQRQTGDRGVSSFPGQRRFQSTGGNALSAASQMTNPASNGDMISVTVPAGVLPGQTIQVNSPDGRIVHAQVPHGMSSGSQFMVSMPPRSVTPPASAPIQDYSGIQAMSPPQQHHSDYSQVQPVSPPLEPFVPPVPAHAAPGATTIPASHVMSASSPSSYVRDDIPMAQATPYMTNAVATPVGGGLSSSEPPQQQHTSCQKLLRVQVPPGMAPGSTIHVQVPGENRTIAAQIPYGVSEFHVAYNEAAASQQPTPSSYATTTTPAAPSYMASPFNHHAHQPPPAPQAPPGQKLLLVRVPPGTLPGTIMHVSIPDEPGRMVSATVPPHVSEFHVSYSPSSDNGVNNHNNGNYNNGNYNYNNGNYGNSSNQHRNINHQQQQQRGNYNNSNNNNNNHQGGGMGGMLLPLIGGAALGAAGLGMFSHYEHQQQNQDQYDNSTQDVNYNDNDYGGGGDDYGGGGGDDYGGGGDDYGGGFGGDY